jgi:hypothetical protein
MIKHLYFTRYLRSFFFSHTIWSYHDFGKNCWLIFYNNLHKQKGLACFFDIYLYKPPRSYEQFQGWKGQIPAEKVLMSSFNFRRSACIVVYGMSNKGEFQHMLLLFYTLLQVRLEITIMRIIVITEVLVIE